MTLDMNFLCAVELFVTVSSLFSLPSGMVALNLRVLDTGTFHSILELFGAPSIVNAIINRDGDEPRSHWSVPYNSSSFHLTCFIKSHLTGHLQWSEMKSGQVPPFCNDISYLDPGYVCQVQYIDDSRQVRLRFGPIRPDSGGTYVCNSDESETNFKPSSTKVTVIGMIGSISAAYFRRLHCLYVL